MPDDSKTRVCIVLEGSYPFITGGVSAWVHDLILGLPEVEFSLFTISPTEDQELRYELPDNVTGVVDIVVSAKHHSAARPNKKLFSEIQGLHKRMFNGSKPDIANLIKQHPEGYFLHEDSVTNDVGWGLITESNLRHNPLYPFADYFWAWKSAHNMLFSVLGAKLPEADIYHAVSTGFAGIAALATKIRYGKPFLLTEHGLYHKEREMEIRKSDLIRGYQRDMWVKMYNQLSNICYSSADIITALFELNRQKQHELGADPKRTFVVPNGIDIEKFSIERRPRSSGFHVGLVGRVVPIKDIKTFIATAKIICDAIPEAEIHCIGPTDEDPAYYEDCQLLVESMKLQDRFYFTGRQNVLEYYSFLDVVLLTSVREAQPLVILEAYAAGVPFVSTNVGNVAELINFDYRFIAPSKDAEKLAEGVIYIHDHPEELDEMRKNNRQRVINLYDKYDLHKKYANMYSALAEGREITAAVISKGIG